MSIVSVVPTTVCSCGMNEAQAKNLTDNIFVDRVEDDCGSICADGDNEKIEKRAWDMSDRW